MECISVSLRHHRTLSRRWDHFHYGACVYVYGCRLFPAIKKRWFPRNCRRDFFGFLADSHGYIFSPCFCWYYRSMGCICGKTGRVFRGSASQTETARQTSKSWSWTSSLTTKPFYLHSIKSLGLSRNSVKNPNAKLFAPQVLNYVLKPTEPPGLGQWLPGAD